MKRKTMKRKATLVAVVALGTLAIASLPSMAIAEETELPTIETSPVVDLPTYPTTFSGSSGNTATLWETVEGKQKEKVVCKEEGETPALEIDGEFTTAHTGSAKFTFHNCREKALNSKCTTSGQSSGTINTTTLPFHTVNLEPENAEEPHEKHGVLFTPNQENTVNENHWFAHFSCVGGFVSITVGGNGVLGTVTAPETGTESESFTTDVSAPEGIQEHTKTVEENEYGLKVVINGGETTPAAENIGSATAGFVGVSGETTTEAAS